MMCYARADAFRERVQDRIDVLMNTLGFDHFFVGLDGFSSGSLRAMNKGINRRANDTDDLLHHNLVACQEIARRGGKLSAGAVMRARNCSLRHSAMLATTTARRPVASAASASAR